jgi:hypothetical protein
MYMGTSLIITLYLAEDWARKNVNDNYIRDYWGMLSPLIPRTFYINNV